MGRTESHPSSGGAVRHCAASRGGYGSLPPGRARRPVSVAHPGARTNFTSFRGHAFGGPWMQEVLLPLARTPPLAVTTRGNHTTLGHGPLPWVTVRNPIDPAGAVWLPRPTAHSRMHAIHQPLHVSRSIELSSESRFPLGKFRVFPAFSPRHRTWRRARPAETGPEAS